MDETKVTNILQVSVRAYKVDRSSGTETIDTSASKLCTLRIEDYIPERATEGNIKSNITYLLTQGANGPGANIYQNNIYKFIDTLGDEYLFTDKLEEGAGTIPVKNLIETASTTDETTTTLANIGWVE